MRRRVYMCTGPIPDVPEKGEVGEGNGLSEISSNRPVKKNEENVKKTGPRRVL